MKRWIIALLLPLGLIGQNAQALLEMKAPTSLVTDFSNVLSANDKAFLENKLLDYADLNCDHWIHRRRRYQPCYR